MPETASFDPGQSAKNDAEPPPIPDHELLRCIGRGSYGEVWLARNIVGTFRAVKVLRRATFERAEHFEREFRGIQKFEPISRSHEGFVDVLQIGRNDEAGYFYYVMELADCAKGEKEKGRKGEDENNITAGTSSPFASAPLPLFSSASYTPCTLRAEQQRRTRLPMEDCISIGVALASALAHLHQHGLVHRDVKPSNIIFVGGVPKLADIGLVADASEARSFVGTVGFIPPEGPGSPQADLYSLGKVLYEISTGKDRQEFPQFPGDLAERTGATQFVELNAVILKACQPDLRARHQSAAEMHKELELLQRGGSVKRKRAVERRWTLLRKSSAAAATLALLGTGGWLLFNRLNNSGVQRINGVPEVNSIAVLPFVNETTNWAPHEYLSDSLTDETMNALTNCAGLRVTPRPAVFAFKRTTNDLRQIGEQLGVRTVLAGSMKKSSNQLQIAARLIRVADGSNVWSVRFDREAQDIGAMQSGVARQVARQLALALDEQALRRMETNLTRKLAAYKLYSQAITNWRNTQEGLDRGIRLLSQAIAEDPNHALAFAELALRTAEASTFYLPQGQAMDQAKAYSQRALQLDDTLPVAHRALALVLTLHELDIARAKVHFQRAIELAPSDGVGFGDYATALLHFGLFKEAEEVLMRGDQIDPKDHNLLGGWCWRYYLDRDFAKAMQAANLLQTVHPGSVMGPYNLALAHEGLREYDKALAMAQRATQMDPSPDTVSLIGRLHARLGHRDQAQKALEGIRLLAQSPGGDRTFSAQVLLALGENDRAIESLRRAVADYPPTVLVLKANPLWDDLRSDAHFQALLQRSKLGK